MGKKRQAKKTNDNSDNAATVVRGNDVRFELSDENSTGSTRRKSKSKKKPSEIVPEAEVYDNEAEYPSSRIIKRAPNGDVIVESLEETERAKPAKEDPGISTKLDMHWETLSSEEKKRILRIEKQEVFEVIKNYQSSNNCNCSVCGRRNVAMEQELEQIYNRLHDNAKESNSDTDFVLFHLNMIKELQKANSSANFDGDTSADTSAHSATTNSEQLNTDQLDTPSPQYLDEMRDEAVKYCLSSKAVESLKEEVLQFKHNKQRQQQLHHQQQQQQHHQTNQHSPLDERHNIGAVSEHLQPVSLAGSQRQQYAQASQHRPDDYLKSFEGTSNETPSQLREKDLQIRQLLQQQRPPNAANIHLQAGPQSSDVQQDLLGSELSQRMAKIPFSDDQEPATNEELKDRYMNFAKTFVSSHPKIAQEYVNRMMMYPDMRALTEDLMYNNGQSFIKAMEDYVVQKGNEPADGQQIDESQEAGQIPADRVPLTPDQYASIQRHIAAGMTASFESQARELQSIRESDGKGLFEQFLAGEDPISMLLKSFTTHNGQQGEQMMATQEIQEEIDYDDEEEYDEEEYSDYEDEEESIYEEEAYEENVMDEDEYLHHHHSQQHQNHHHEHELDLGEEDVSTAGNEEDYDSGIDEQERLEEGRRLIQIAITKLLQKKLVDSYQEKQAENNRLRLLQELEAEEQKKREKEEKKQRKREKEKEKKRAQQVAKEQEKKRKEEEEVRAKKEAEEREMQRREAQRQRVEETRRKKDEEKRRKLEEQRRKEEEQQRQKKLKEEQKRKREEEKRLKEEAKRQKEEELKAQKEQKRLELERKKQLEDAANAQQEIQKRRSSETPSQRRLSTPPEAVPYAMPQSSVDNDDLFHMINEAASKSLSTPSSHLQTLLQPQVARPTIPQPPATGLSLNNMGVNSTNWQASEPFSNASYDSLATGAKSLDNSWSNMGGLFQMSPRKVQPSEVDNQNAIPVHNPMSQYSQFGTGVGDRKKSFHDELDNLTNFLSSTSLAGNHSSSAGFQVPENMWSSTDQKHHSSVPYMTGLNSSTPVNNAVKPQRKSIWENDAPLGSSPSVGNIAPNIWNGVSSIAPAVSSNHLAEAILQAYSLVRGELNKDFVDVEKLYHTTLSLLQDANALTYNNYVNQVVGMRSTHNCEVLTNVSGSVTHVRFPYSYLQQQQQPPRTQTNFFNTTAEVIQGQSPLKNTTYPHALFGDLYNGNNGAMSAPGATAVPGVNASHYNYGHTFGKARTNNIWG
ncbi:LAME_0D06810g1_1 [Lachancea meyersii CBS 8951]|uniref:Stress response protein NST1 n=1 Tax=Lachancea meyersii CBS 8951 TaxID=1266667 RepID=A0A1G4J9A4_9SACH|nr:LAME_0D06810g1_1 [Lachancea meyersii CBS 8951]